MYLKKDGFDERVNSRCESRVPVFLEESGSPEAPQEDSTFAEDREEVQHLQIVSNTFQKKCDVFFCQNVMRFFVF